MKILALVLMTLVGLQAFANEGGEHEELFPIKQADKSMVAVPARTELLEPKAFSTQTGDKALLKWAQVGGADFYHVQVATDANFKWLVAEEFNNTTTSFEVSKLEKAKHYFWRVAARRSTNDPSYTKGAWSNSMFDTK